MPKIAYIANQFPSPVEPYVMEEIRELRGRGVEVIPCSVRFPDKATSEEQKVFSAETLYFHPLRFWLLAGAVWLCLKRTRELADLTKRVILRGNEPLVMRMRTLLHTWLGAYYGLLLERHRVEHIHVHHGYFASWITLVASRLLGISFSITLHGSDLLLHPRYLEIKLQHCKFCVTISEFNRQHILKRYPECDPSKILVQRLGVSPLAGTCSVPESIHQDGCVVMLAVGRLHPVKNHAFLLQACRLLKDRSIRFECRIAGEGEDRASLERLIRKLDLHTDVQLLGHLPRPQLHDCYENSTLFVLTSRSEGIPLVLMEAMAHGKTVLAPAITGIPELVCDGKTGFLYQPGSLQDFVRQVELISKSHAALGLVREAARQRVLAHFNREKNLVDFGETFLSRIGGTMENKSYENPVLQQI